MSTSAYDEFVTRLFQPAPWVADAACRNHPTEWWFPQRGGSPDMQKAKNICATCPVATECADAGENEAYGIWGGVAGRTRQRTRGHGPRRSTKVRADPTNGGRANPNRWKPIEHGTRAGYRAELRRGLEPCAACLDAEAERIQQRRTTRKAAA